MTFYALSRHVWKIMIAGKPVTDLIQMICCQTMFARLR